MEQANPNLPVPATYNVVLVTCSTTARAPHDFSITHYTQYTLSICIYLRERSFFLYNKNMRIQFFV